MQSLTSKTVTTMTGDKEISVHACNILELDEPIDIMTISAFYRNYEPTPGTLLEALKQREIDIEALALEPEIDLRKQCGIWLSGQIPAARLPIGRIGCIEMSPYERDRSGWHSREKQIISSIQAYFRLLDIASLMGLPMETVGIPVLGGGSQRISVDLVTRPIMNECMRFLKSNDAVRQIRIITNNHRQAFHFAQTLENSYSVYAEKQNREIVRQETAQRRSAFISYSSGDKNVADNLCAKLEGAGIRVWYAPRDIPGNDFASAIVKAISQVTDFIVIISSNSLKSNHVLNEIDLAFQRLSSGIRFHPLRLDEEEMLPAFQYYLSRQHWMDAHVPPLEKRLEEFAKNMSQTD